MPIPSVVAGVLRLLDVREALTLRSEIDAVATAIGRPIEITEQSEQEALTGFAPAAPRPLIEAMLLIWKATLEDRHS